MTLSFRNYSSLLIVSYFFFNDVFANASSTKREVLIYYANESAPDKRESENYKNVYNFLREISAPKAKELLSRFDEDLATFPKVVDDELKSLIEGLKHADADICALAFTNRLGRKGQFLHACAGDNDWTQGYLKPALDYNYILLSNPNSNSATLDMVFTTAATLHPPENTDFYFVSKSHGSVTMAMMPILRLRFEDANRDEIIKTLMSDSKKSEEAKLPPEIQRVGIAKDQYYAAFDRAQKLGMTFKLVFAESCFSSLPGKRKDWSLPDNITTLYASVGSYASYTTLNYANILAEASTTKSLKPVMEEALSKNFTRIEKRRPYWLYVLVLGCFFGVFAIIRKLMGFS